MNTEQASEDSNIGIKTEIPDIKEETTKLLTEHKEIKDDKQVTSEKLGKTVRDYHLWF